MKKRIGLSLATVLSMLIMPVGNALAMEVTTATPNTTEENSATETNDIEDDTTAKDYKTRLDERIAKRRSAMKEKVTAAQQARIKAKCKAAQTVIAKISTKSKEVKTNRETIYTNIIDRITKLRDKLKANGKDTAKLDTNITELQALVDKFSADLKALRQAASDVSGMECETAPVGFKASLDELRTDRETLQADSEAVRAYIKDKLKPVLQEIKTAHGSDVEKEETK